MAGATRKFISLFMVFLLAGAPLAYAGPAMHMTDCPLYGNADVSAAPDMPAAVLSDVVPGITLADADAGTDSGNTTAVAQNDCQSGAHDCVTCLGSLVADSGAVPASIMMERLQIEGIRPLLTSIVPPAFRPPIPRQG